MKNLRSLADTGWVDIKPLTLLVGSNSSGKSTFLRTFPLLRQSVEARTAGSILWFGTFVDFGDFAEALRSGSDPPVISLGFRFPLTLPNAPVGRLREMRPGLLDRRQGSKSHDVSVSVDLVQEGQSARTAVAAVEFCIDGNVVVLGMRRSSGSDSGAVHLDRFEVNGREMLHYEAYAAQDTGDMLPVLREIVVSGRSESMVDEFGELISSDVRRRRKRASDVQQELVRQARGLFGRGTSEETIRNTLDTLTLGSDEEVLDSMRESSQGTKVWKRTTADLDVDSERFKVIRDLSLASVLPRLLAVANSYLKSYSRQVAYSAPLRAITQRYYRPQNLAVEEVDHEGENLPMFLSNLNRGERQRFQRWTEAYLGFSVSTVSNGGHISLKIEDSRSKIQRNLADTGFGLSQVLPIIAQLWSLSESPARLRRRFLGVDTPLTFVIEQPELHLHPALQARIMDLLLESIAVARKHRIDLRLIIETHSEAMVNRAGHRIAAELTKPEDVQIVLFDQERENCSEVRLAEYDEEGFLTNWPYGFFQPEII